MRSGFYIYRRQAAEKIVHVVRLAFFPCPISCKRVERLRIICGFLMCVYCDTVSNEKSEISDILYSNVIMSIHLLVRGKCVKTFMVGGNIIGCKGKNSS